MKLDTMEQEWGCTNCSSKFLFKELKCIDGANQFGVACPVCASGVHLFKPSTQTVLIEEYHGEKGTIQ